MPPPATPPPGALGEGTMGGTGATYSPPPPVVVGRVAAGGWPAEIVLFLEISFWLLPISDNSPC